MAGIEGVIWTNLIQTIFLVVAGIACLLFIGNMLPGGLTSIGDVLPGGRDESSLGVEKGAVVGCVPLLFYWGMWFLYDESGDCTALFGWGLFAVG